MSTEYLLKVRRKNKLDLDKLFNKLNKSELRIGLDEALSDGRSIKKSIDEISSKDVVSLINKCDEVHLTVVLSESNSSFNKDDFEIFFSIYSDRIEVRVEDYLFREGFNDSFRSFLLALNYSFNGSKAEFFNDDDLIVNGNYSIILIDKIGELLKK